MRRISKKILLITIAMMLLSNMVFASEQVVIANISNSILNIVLWFGYAIMLGVTIFIGIKYVTSGANERANIKGMIPKYLIGAAIIIMAFTIAQIVSNIAGNDTAEEIIGVGANAGTTAVTGGGTTSGGSNAEVTQKVTVKKNGKVLINHPSNLSITVDDHVNNDPTLYAPLQYDGKTFSHWEVTRTTIADGSVSSYNVSSSVYQLVGSDAVIGDIGAMYKYNVTPIYE